MNDDRILIQAYRTASDLGLRSVLAVIVRIDGSSYRRAGAKMLVREDGLIAGAVSGGCLERDLIRRAARLISRATLARGTPLTERVTYDTRYDGIEDFGETDGDDGEGDPSVVRTSLGCEGLIEILLDARPAPWIERLERVASARVGEERAIPLDGGGTFVDRVEAPVRVVVFGAGHDAVAMSRFARELGWEVAVVDCRSAFPQPGSRFSHVDAFVRATPETAARATGCDSETIAIVMTHNIDHDAAIVRALIPLRPRYLGILGPRARAEKFLAPAELALPFVRSPLGLDLGGDGPEAIALAAFAEIQALRHAKSPVFLKERPGPIHARGIPAIVLAAGKGTRLGGVPKALVRFGGTTFLERAVATLRSVPSIGTIRIVIGAHADAVRAEAVRLGREHARIEVVENADFERGAMSSLRAGIRATSETEIGARDGAALVTLVDLPTSSAASVERLLAEYFARTASDESPESPSRVSLARLVHDGVPGHPCLLAQCHFAEILAAPESDRGAAFLFRTHPDRVLEVQVEDAGVVRDIDTPEQLAAIEVATSAVSLAVSSASSAPVPSP